MYFCSFIQSYVVVLFSESPVSPADHQLVKVSEVEESTDTLVADGDDFDSDLVVRKPLCRRQQLC